MLALESVATLLTLLLGGVLADRYSRRGLMIASDLSRAAVAAVFCVMDASGHLTLTSVFVLAACFGLADGFFQPAFGGIVPLVVETADAGVGELVVRDRAARERGRRARPSRPGSTGTAGPPVVWGLEAVSFVVAAAAVVLARPRRAGAGGAARHAARARRGLPLRRLGGVALDGDHGGRRSS